ncbi:ATP-binding protein [Corynebacterium auriscanis]|uniref:ATP-binding protein n=1 Tax=Corynebacterium auriscanis TaxID=99807 RepID=UPI003CF9F8F4
MREEEFTIISAALEAIWTGATGDSQETPTLDFKEDPARHPNAKNPDASLVEFLIEETICFSNADNGTSFLILGVADKQSGPQAFTGTDREIDWIVHKIFENTRPNIRVEGEELMWHGVRLIVLRIPQGITLYQRTKGQASRRVGTRCEPLTEEQRRRIYFERANPDFTSLPSRRAITELDLTAVDQARQLLAQARQAQGNTDAVPQTTHGLLGELGLLNADGHPTFAAEVLFMTPLHNRVIVRHLLRSVPGGEPKTTELSVPLITGYLRLRELIAANAHKEVERIELPTGQEIAVTAFPDSAVDELVSNALAHRDWDATSAVIIDQSPTSLTVWSPGALPTGVTPSRLLSTQSIPRNPRLMSALRMLGLVEESSRGFDRIWASMLASGRRTPALNTTDNYVEVTLSSGQVDTGFIQAVSTLKAEFDAPAFESVNGLLIARHLADNPVLLSTTAANLMQVDNEQALGVVQWYESLGFLEKLRQAPEWILSPRARTAMGLVRDGELASTSIQDWILTQLRAGEVISAREVADELGVERTTVTEILRHLRRVGHATIDPQGPQRGANTRWRSA